MDTWALRAEIPTAADVTALALSPDGATVAVLCEDGSLALHDIDSKKVLLWRKPAAEHPRGGVVAFSPDGGRVFAVDDRREAISIAHEIHLASGKAIATYKVGTWLTAAHYVSKDEVVVTGSDGAVLYTTVGAPREALQAGQKVQVDGLSRDLGVSPDGALFCAGNSNGPVACFARDHTSLPELKGPWAPKRRALLVDLSLLVQVPQGACDLSGTATLPLPAGVPVEKALEGLGAKGAIAVGELLR